MCVKNLHSAGNMYKKGTEPRQSRCASTEDYEIAEGRASAQTNHSDY